MQRLRSIGFWFNPLAPNGYPLPQLLVGWRASARRAAVVAYLRGGRRFAAYRGHSWCRFDCGIARRELGHRDLTDGTWVWPEGLAHYVEVHGVRLPDELVRHAVRGAAARPIERGAIVDDGPWLAWGRAQGACLDRGRWRSYDGPALDGLHPVLHRPDTGAILCTGLGDDDYVVIDRRGRRRAGRWLDWPRARSGVA